MLRKTLDIFLAGFLLVATTGLTFSLHYCGDELISASFSKNSDSCCDGSGGCCENKTFHFEARKEFINPPVVECTTLTGSELLFPVLFHSAFELIPNEVKVFRTFIGPSPPGNVHSRLSILQTYLC